ncbi:MAG: hypothetical protein LBE18_08895 [Planctomycetaceae bacterium]|jgi:adenosylhomocysteine nucleosidase|nr:hypothetical protein [Planctomycetaceae bacterium]
MSDSIKVDLGFVFATPMEAAGLVDLLENCVTSKGNGRIFHRGKLKKIPIAIVESGMGQEKAVAATNALLDIFCPSFIISAGYAGGLLPQLKRFSIHQPNLLLRISDGMSIDLSENMSKSQKNFIRDNSYSSKNQPNESSNEDSHEDSQSIVTKNRNILITVDQPIETVEQKLLLGEKYGAEIVDMETFAIAETCIDRNLKSDNLNNVIRFNSVRIILDAANDELPKEIKRIMQSYERSTARMFGTTLSSLFRRPSIIFDLYSLKERALQAADILSRYIVSTMLPNIVR